MTELSPTARHNLIGLTAEKLQSFLLADPSPTQIREMTASCKPFAALVASELDALQVREPPTIWNVFQQDGPNHLGL